jgi:hypothetical protein
LNERDGTLAGKNPLPPVRILKIAENLPHPWLNGKIDPDLLWVGCQCPMPGRPVTSRMTITATGSSHTRPSVSGRRVVACLLLLAFMFQSYLTQTHTHSVPPAGLTHQIVAKIPAHGKTPFDNGPATCPFCQAVAHAGAFFAPATPVFLATAWAMLAPPVVTVRLTAGAVLHAWQSRAPPRH